MIIYDAHTHQLKRNSVVNIDQLQNTSNHNIDYCSKGVHPWSLKNNRNVKELLKLISEIEKDKYLLAIGETGLDKLSPEYETQKVLLSAHVELAQHLNLPMIVHCVKSQNDILKMLKEKSFKNKILFHGYNGSREEAIDLVKKGYRIGIGPQLFKAMKINKYLHEIPLENLLLETDDSELNINEVFVKLSTVLNRPKDDLANILNSNFNQFFNG